MWILKKGEEVLTHGLPIEQDALRTFEKHRHMSSILISKCLKLNKLL